MSFPSCSQLAATASRYGSYEPDGQKGHASQCLDATADLIERANSGDQLAWETLLQRHLHPLKVVARSRLPVHLRATVDTDDVVQEALARSIRHLRHFECRGRGALLAYLRRAVINRVVDTIRYNARQPERLELRPDRAETVQSPLERILEREERARYRAGLMRLRVRDRQLIVLRIHHGLSYQEI